MKRWRRVISGVLLFMLLSAEAWAWLPYRGLNLPQREPKEGVSVIPAYKGGPARGVTPEDTEETAEAPQSYEIAVLAQSLNWSPVLIYEYVKHTIETEWYWGCMKGAQETLRQKSGNDCDQASLLAALLRVSGFPARYVRGSMEFFAGGQSIDMDRARNLLGIDDPAAIADFFRRAGIPYRPILAGGKIENFEVEHIWIETQVPWGNYRGTIIDDSDKSWIGLDTSIKTSDYQYSNLIDIYQEPALSSQLAIVKDEYLNAVRAETPLEYLRALVEGKLSQSHPGRSYGDLMRTRTLPPDILKILPSSLQFTQRSITHEYREIPDELKHKVRFVAGTSGPLPTILFDITLDTLDLSNQMISLSYEAETVEDQAIIDANGGLDNTPAYSVRLRPVLSLNDGMVAAGSDGLAMGTRHDLSIELISPSGPAGVEKITGSLTAGTLVAIGIAAGRVTPSVPPIPQEGGNDGADAGTILSKEAYRYIDRWNHAEEELAALLQFSLSRPIPTVVLAGGVTDVTYQHGMPYSLGWKGVYLDAPLRVIEATPFHSPVTQGEEADRKKTFMQISGMQGSILANRVFEDDFGVEGISAAKLMAVARGMQVPVLSIDKTNISAVLPSLNLWPDMKMDITDAVNQGLGVTAPQSEITYLDWKWTGYIKKDPATEGSGYMLPGEIAGGMTAVSPDNWPSQYLAKVLAKPYSSEYTLVAITYPAHNAVLAAARTTVTGKVLDPDAQVNVNGVQAMMFDNTFTAAGIPLVRGLNTITATATTSKGNIISQSIQVKYKVPLKTYISFPFYGLAVSGPSVDVEGMVSDNLATVEVNGIKAAVSADGRFIARGVALAVGSNLITATAVNQEGEADTFSISVECSTQQTRTIPITITSPQNNAVISRTSVMVTGTITIDDPEVSIKVNGVPAEIYNGQFTANRVSLDEGENSIIVNATDSSGAIGRAEVMVRADTTLPYVTLTANITSGIPDLTTYFAAGTAIPNPVAMYQIDYNGDGVIDYTGTTFEDMQYTYTTGGIYFPTITVTDDQGNVYTDTIAITLLNKDKINALLKGKWEKMKGALIQGDIEGALVYFMERSKERYRSLFAALKDQLPMIFGTFVEFNITDIYEVIAEIEIVANEDGKLYSYPGVFIKDGNGIWKLKNY
ncbi:MAG: transglutaminase domain-containing protein [Nitrospirae bacterium]|nr:MAG: transglutaminase domain-containing protein [Nitrospirota bacterium]